MIRAFLDANVLLDIELRNRARYEPIKVAAFEGSLVALVSVGVLEEVRTALDVDPDLRQFRQHLGLDADRVLREILIYTRFAGGFAFARRILRRDRSDEPILAAALAGEARYLVTRNVDDFAEAPTALEVIHPDELVEILRSRS